MLHVERRTLVSVALGRRLVDDTALRALTRRGHVTRDDAGHPKVTPAGVEAALTRPMWDVLDACAHGRVEWADNGCGGAAVLDGRPVGTQIGPLERLALAGPAPPLWSATERGLLLLALRAAADGST